MMVCQFHDHPQPVQTSDELRQQVQASWSAVVQEAIRHLYDIMSHRTKQCIANNGNCTTLVHALYVCTNV